MKLDPVPLFGSFRETTVFAAVMAFIFIGSLALEYHRYRDLTRFDDAEVNATVLNQYVKQKGSRHYHVLKLRLGSGALFYMTGSMRLRDLKGYTVRVWIRTGEMTYLEYLKGFYARGYVKAMAPEPEGRYAFSDAVASQHSDAKAGELFGALFAATPVSYDTRQRLSALGISHLLAISGFHMGALSLILFWLLRYPYRFAQSRWFPWRHGRRDLFVAAAFVLIGYASFLGGVPSVLRALAMMLIGFFLYDRGIRVLNLQTLLIALTILLAFWPRLLFSVGFWLSAAGVFYIFLFLRAFNGRKKVFHFVGLHVWVYVMMLPWGLYLFESFSLLHPISIVWTMAFVLFYPTVLLAHLIGEGSLLDPLLLALLQSGDTGASVSLSPWSAGAFLLLSLFAFESQKVKWLLGGFASAVFVGAVYQVA